MNVQFNLVAMKLSNFPHIFFQVGKEFLSNIMVNAWFAYECTIREINTQNLYVQHREYYTSAIRFRFSIQQNQSVVMSILSALNTFNQEYFMSSLVRVGRSFLTQMGQNEIKRWSRHWGHPSQPDKHQKTSYRPRRLWLCDELMRMSPKRKDTWFVRILGLWSYMCIKSQL